MSRICAGEKSVIVLPRMQFFTSMFRDFALLELLLCSDPVINSGVQQLG